MVRENQQLSPSMKALQLFKNGHALVECNLLDYPLCLLSDNNLKKLLKEAVETGKSHIRYEIVDADGTKRVWRLRPTIETGYTTTFDKDVVFAVFKLVTDEQFPPPMLWKLDSCRRICETLQISPKGKSLKRVREALQRIASTPIYAETFYLKKSKTYWRDEQQESLGGVFTLWSIFWKNEQLPNGEIADAVYIQFNAPCIRGLQEFYVKPLDFDYWLSLSPLQKRLYELTGRKFYGLKDSPYAKFDYLDLCQALPIIPQKHISLAKRILERAHRGLKLGKWFDHVEWIKKNKHSWEIRYYPGPRVKLEIAQGKERLRRFLMRRTREELPDWQNVQVWVAQLTEDLHDHHGKNRGFYTKLAQLIVQGKIKPDLVWYWLSVTKDKALRHELKTTRSAYFTGGLKRDLKAKGKDLNQLMKQGELLAATRTPRGAKAPP